jgi:hypothetical protein
MASAAPKDEEGVTLKHGDFITFTFGIPPTCVTARLSLGPDGWSVECIHPEGIKPKHTSLSDLTRYYQIWKASKARVQAALRDFSEPKGGSHA